MCRSLERHRFLALLLEGLCPVIATSRLVVDVAPSAQVSKIFRRIAPSHYVRIDFDPAADSRAVDVQASLTALPFSDRSVDFLLCYHVLEHVPDDAAAMAEIARTLSDGGVALVQVPWRPDRLTDEDPDAPEEERLRRFGQADHVRWYGADFEDRLHKAGLLSCRLTPREVLGDGFVELFRLVPDESVWVLRRDAGERRDDLTGETVRMRTLRHVAELYGAAEARAAEAEALAAKWENAYRRLRNQRVIRAVAALASPVRKRLRGAKTG